ncbi:MAG: methyltransferase domain-containing protein [Actinomycetota bacterium]
MRGTYGLMYRLGLTPWVRPAVPAELSAVVAGPSALPPGRAVDLGCGTGEHARYTAALGWSVTGVDFVPRAVATARRRDVPGLVDWRTADVTKPRAVDPGGTLAGGVQLLLDAGCLHGLTPSQRHGWADTVLHLSAPAATLLIHAVPAARRGIGPAGIDAAELDELLNPNWRLLHESNTWYRFERRAEALPR